MNELVLEKILLAKKYLEEAESELRSGNGRITVRSLDYSKENIQEAIYLAIDTIVQKEGYFDKKG